MAREGGGAGGVGVVGGVGGVVVGIKWWSLFTTDLNGFQRTSNWSGCFLMSAALLIKSIRLPGLAGLIPGTALACGSNQMILRPLTNWGTSDK